MADEDADSGGSLIPSSALLIRVTGHDRPGVTHALTSILARYDARVLDIGQAVIHDGLAFGILIELTETLRSTPLLTDLLLEAHRLGVEVKFSASSAEEYEAWVGAQARRRFIIITLLGPEITATHIADVSGVLAGAGLNIDRIDRLSSRLGLRSSDGQPRFCVEFTATSPAGTVEVDAWGSITCTPTRSMSGMESSPARWYHPSWTVLEKRSYCR